MASKKTDQEIRQSKTDATMNLIARRAAYYRANSHRFAEEYLNVHLKLFQKILLYAMMVNDYFLFIASRGLSKTWLTALFSVIRCILYPGTKVIAVSATFKQGKEIILKITDDFMKHSSLLRQEISKVATGQNECGVWFKNGSWIQVRVASESSRGARSNIVIIDESRLVNQKIVDTVIRPMNASPRTPGYLNKPEYKHLQEMNKEMYMSSAWYKSSELFDKFKAYTANFLDPNRKYFVCDLPYQLSISEGLLMKESIENEMSEETFSDISFQMEREGIFFGSSEDALFNFKVLNDRRILPDGLRNLEFYRDLGIPVPRKTGIEQRILSLDIALLASRKHDNDASCFIINQLLQSSADNQLSNIGYIETQEGLLTEELGLLTMRYFYQYNCDYLAIDCSGIGQSVLDYIMADRYDPMYGTTYKAMTCINNDDLAIRCKVRDANKCVYAIKANAKQNNDMVLSLRSGFQNGYINLLTTENDIDEYFAKHIKGYSKMTDNQKARLRMPYYQTSFLIDELINLDHDVSNNLIKVKEKSGMRKDRFSSLEYNYYVVDQLRLKRKNREQVNNLVDLLPMSKGKRFSSF